MTVSINGRIFCLFIQHILKYLWYAGQLSETLEIQKRMGHGLCPHEGCVLQWMWRENKPPPQSMKSISQNDNGGEKPNLRKKSLQESAPSVSRTESTQAAAKAPWQGFCLSLILQFWPAAPALDSGLRCPLPLFTYMSWITWNSTHLNMNLSIVVFSSLAPQLGSGDCPQSQHHSPITSVSVWVSVSSLASPLKSDWDYSV